jgi:hypothetical protein
LTKRWGSPQKDPIKLLRFVKVAPRTLHP